MTTLLLMISFLLHIVVLWAVMQLFQQLQAMKQQHEYEKQSIEAALKMFVDEMKIENKQLLTALQQNKQDSNVAANLQEVQLTEAPRSKEEQVEVAQQSFYEIPIEKEDIIETSVTGKIFQLYEAGATIEEIAKKLHKGKTEVALILKLQKK